MDAQHPARPLVLDTNIVLDLLVFSDPRIQFLRESLQAMRLRWIGTHEMRTEFERVLDYPHLRARREFHGWDIAGRLAAYDQACARVDVAPRAEVRCKDPDDQKFIDLAVAHGAVLLSKDQAVLAMRKRCAARGAWVGSEWKG